MSEALYNVRLYKIMHRLTAEQVNDAYKIMHRLVLLKKHAHGN